MAQVTQVTEYRDEGIAIIEDSLGKYAATKESPNIIPIYDDPSVQSWFGHRTPCALLQSRTAMMT